MDSDLSSSYDDIVLELLEQAENLKFEGEFGPAIKVLEKVVKLLFLDNIAVAPLQHQHGFTTGLSCDSALSSAVDYIESAVLKRKFCIGIFCST